MTTTFKYKNKKLTLEKSTYESNNATALLVKEGNGEVYSVLSVNPPYFTSKDVADFVKERHHGADATTR